MTVEFFRFFFRISRASPNILCLHFTFFFLHTKILIASSSVAIIIIIIVSTTTSNIINFTIRILILLCNPQSIRLFLFNVVFFQKYIPLLLKTRALPHTHPRKFQYCQNIYYLHTRVSFSGYYQTRDTQQREVGIRWYIYKLQHRRHGSSVVRSVPCKSDSHPMVTGRCDETRALLQSAPEPNLIP